MTNTSGTRYTLPKKFCSGSQLLSFRKFGFIAMDVLFVHRWYYAERLILLSLLFGRIFLLENLAEVAALGMINFFKQLFLALDFLVVLVSLVFELVFHFNKNYFEKVVEILVLFRVWRFVRIGHVSTVLSADEKHNNP